MVARSADEEVHQAQSGAIRHTQAHSGALRSDEAEIIAPFVEGRNHGSSEVIRGHQRSSEVIAPFVEWHAVVTRTPEEVEDGLVLMRDAIRDAIRDDYGARMFLIGGHQRQSERSAQGGPHLLLLLGVETDAVLTHAVRKLAELIERDRAAFAVQPHAGSTQPQSATIREQSSTIREHSATISLNQGAIREQSATLTFAVQLDELVGHERGEALTKLAWLCLLIHIGLDLMREAIRAALRDEGRNQAQPNVMREAIREACWEAHLHTW